MAGRTGENTGISHLLAGIRASMVAFGYVLVSEEWGPRDLVDLAVRAQDVGFETLAISDHFHPWNDDQGHSPFVWGVIGALSREVDLTVSTHVTAPIVLMHPAIVAHAAATASLQCGGGFALGVGSGEALNEQVLGDRWPLAAERLAMLEEAVSIMRELWSGEVVTRHGTHYTVEHARIYSKPEERIPVYVSALGPRALEVAGRIGDGYVSVSPSTEAIAAFRAAGGAGKHTQAGMKVCYGQDLESHRLAVQEYVDAGFDEVLIAQVGPLQDEFFSFAANELLPALRAG